MTDASAARVDAGGVLWHVERSGRGPTMLLVHGTGASAASFRDLAPLLARRFSLVVPDLPGHARSSTPPGNGLSVDGMAASLAALVVALDAAPAIAVGHSAGAAVLVRMALDGHLPVRALVGLNAALVPLDGPLRLFSPIAKLLAAAPFVPRIVAGLARDDRAVERLVAGTGSTIGAEGTRTYAALVRDPRHVAGAVGMMASWNLDRTWAQMPRLVPPPLLVVGDRDRAVPPSQARRVASRVPGATIADMPGLGHLSHEEDPAGTAALIVAHAMARGVLATNA